jgi:hypothetical protein
MSNHINDATKYLLEHIERSMFFPDDEHVARRNLQRFLHTLGIKSAKISLEFGAPLQMESLEATLKQVTFDTKHLSLWKKKP